MFWELLWCLETASHSFPGQSFSGNWITVVCFSHIWFLSMLFPLPFSSFIFLLHIFPKWLCPLCIYGKMPANLVKRSKDGRADTYDFYYFFTGWRPARLQWCGLLEEVLKCFSSLFSLDYAAVCTILLLWFPPSKDYGVASLYSYSSLLFPLE